MNFPLNVAFAVSHRFWTVVCLFSFVSRNFLISFFISLLTRAWFNSTLFSLHEFEYFWVFSWGWFLVSVLCGLRKWLIWFQFSWICWGLLCVQSCGLYLKLFHVHFASLGWKDIYILIWFYIYTIYIKSDFIYIYIKSDKSIWFSVHSDPQYPCWYFVWKMCPFLTVGC